MEDPNHRERSGLVRANHSDVFSFVFVFVAWED
jgi:hypothetical protein